LREALAAADHDFVLAESVSKLKLLRQRLFTVKRRSLSRMGRRGRRYLSILAAGFFVAAATGILLNALVWQKTRHPAPLVFSRTTVPIPRLAHPAIPADQAREKPERPLAPKPAIEKAFLGIPSSGNPLHQTRADTMPARPPDQVSELLNAAQSVAVRPVPRAAAPSAPSRAVLAAQRALVKLGFVLKADGVAGRATRQAVRRYERERRLPIGGELTPALMRRLTAEAGIAIN
jgi:hypothetical protein